MSIIKDIYNELEPELRLSVDTLVQTPDVVVVEVSATINGIDEYAAQGWAQRDPEDKLDGEVGLKLAIGRAVRQIGREILKEGQALVRENEKTKQTQKDAAKRARERKVNPQYFCSPGCPLC